MSRRQVRICFVAPSAYPVLAGDRSIAFVGGAEVQQCILAREFSRRGCEVSMVCMDFGQDDGIVVDGIKVHRMHGPEDGIPVIRFIHPRLTSVWAAMRRANADIYYQRTAGSLTAYVVAFAKRYRRRSVYAAASDPDFSALTPHVLFARDRLLYRWGVRHADYVVAQTRAQQATCERTFGRRPAVIRSCYASQAPSANHGGPVIWVGNVIPVKRAELFIELAKRLPQYAFELVGGGQEARVAALRTLATGVSNLRLTGFVPFVDVERHFDGASLLMNTSANEGFPNTFLQAWSRGVPTVSFFDPGAGLDGAAVGAVSTTLDDMVAQVQALKEDRRLWNERCRASRAYFEATFSVHEVGDAYESLLGGMPWQRGAAAVDLP